MPKDYLRLNSLHRKPRRPAKTQELAPIVFSDDYRRMVCQILEEKRRREVVADILNERRKA